MSPRPMASVTEAQQEEAWTIGETVTDRLIADGWICGWPDYSDVATVVRVLHLAGLLRPLAASPPVREPQQ